MRPHHFTKCHYHYFPSYTFNFKDTHSNHLTFTKSLKITVTLSLSLCMRCKNLPVLCNFSVAKATLQSQLSVCPSEIKTPQFLRIAPFDHWAYQPLSQLTIEPIDHQFYRSLSHQPSSLLTIKPTDHWANQPSSISTSGLLLQLLSLLACLQLIQIKCYSLLFESILNFLYMACNEWLLGDRARTIHLFFEVHDIYWW